MNTTCSIVVALAVAAFGTNALAAAPDSTVVAADTAPAPAARKTVNGEVPARIVGVTPLRHHDPAAVITLTLVLSRPSIDAKPAPGAMAAVRKWAERERFTVVGERSDGALLEVKGGIALIERVLGVVINDYDIKEMNPAVVAFANDRNPSVPASLPVDAVLGMNNIPMLAFSR